MSTTIEEPKVQETVAPAAGTMLKEKAADFVKQATAFTARATETLEQQVPEVQRAVERTLHRYDDLKAEMLHTVRAHPGKAVGLALIVGVTIGWVFGTARGAVRARRAARACAEIEGGDAVPM